MSDARSDDALDLVRLGLEESIATKQALLRDEALQAQIVVVAKLCVAALQGGHKIVLAGNGGSASDAQHIAAELVGRFEIERQGLPALALPADSTLLSALANDYGYEQVFARQLRALARPGDVFIGLSTSGNSANVLTATAYCRDAHITSIGLTGSDGGKLLNNCDFCLCVPSLRTARIQESHITIGHILCSIIDRYLAD